MGRDSSSSSGPSFCKFLKPDEDCSSMFQIPPEFVEIYGKNLPENVTFRTHESEKSWRVGIQKIGGNYYFTDDWKRFAEEVDVKLLDYLIFNFLGLSEASTNQLTLRNKKISSGGVDERPIGKAKGKNKDDEYGVSKKCGKWIFIKELTQNDAFRLCVPKKFALGTGIARDGRLVLVDDGGKKWPICVTDGNRDRFMMTHGWRDFLKGNRVAVGTPFSFEFISTSGNLVKARMLEKHVKGGRGRVRLLAFVKRRHKARGHAESLKSEEEEGNDTEHENEDDRISNPMVSGVGGRHWKFVKKLKEHHAFVMDIPKDFATATGIETKEKIKLRVAKGTNWPVDLRCKKCGIVAMTTGWNNFLVGNNVRIGSTISFKFVKSTQHNIIQVRLLDNGGRGNKLFQSIKRGRGRPPKTYAYNQRC